MHKHSPTLHPDKYGGPTQLWRVQIPPVKIQPPLELTFALHRPMHLIKSDEAIAVGVVTTVSPVSNSFYDERYISPIEMFDMEVHESN